jgi:translation initiation factor IF-2
LNELEEKILKLTEFVTVSELASMMSVQPTQVISVCMSLGIFASINQRLVAETIQIVADEFGYETEFVSAEVQEAIQVVEDKEEVVEEEKVEEVVEEKKEEVYVPNLAYKVYDE